MHAFESYLKQAEACERQAEACAPGENREHLLAAALQWRTMAGNAVFASAGDLARRRRGPAVTEVAGRKAKGDSAAGRPANAGS